MYTWLELFTENVLLATRLMRMLFIGALLSLSGCDFMYGVNRIAPVAVPTSWQCISSTIESIPEITDVRYSEEQGSQPITWSGVQRPTVVRRYRYRTASLDNELYFTERFDGSVEYHHGRLYMNHKPSQAEFDKFIPLIHRVELALQGSCGIGKISAQEYCAGMRCEVPSITNDGSGQKTAQ